MNCPDTVKHLYYAWLSFSQGYDSGHIHETVISWVSICGILILTWDNISEDFIFTTHCKFKQKSAVQIKSVLQ